MDLLSKYLNNSINFDEILKIYKESYGTKFDFLPSAILLYDLNNYIAEHSEIEKLRRMDYSLYLKTKEWRAKRKIILNIYGHCQLCGNNKEPFYHIHHNNYENLPLEGLTDLIVLCEYCHNQFHRDRETITEYAKMMMSWISEDETVNISRNSSEGRAKYAEWEQ